MKFIFYIVPICLNYPKFNFLFHSEFVGDKLYSNFEEIFEFRVKRTMRSTHLCTCNKKSSFFIVQCKRRFFRETETCP
jgi:hypothetical protein